MKLNTELLNSDYDTSIFITSSHQQEGTIVYNTGKAREHSYIYPELRPHIVFVIEDKK